MKNYLLVWICFWCMACSQPSRIEELQELPPVYPDYTNITIPCNIAPLNFLLRSEGSDLLVTVQGQTGELVVKGKNKILFPEKKWKQFLEAEKGNTLRISVTVTKQNTRYNYLPFEWTISTQKIDPYLTYRLIEPGYEVWNRIQLCERHIETFKEKIIADNNLTDNSCMNCHIYGNQDPSLSFFHVRGKNGGTVINRHGKLRKVATSHPSTGPSGVYGGFHPSGRYIVFSNNVIIPQFHTHRSEKLEVYDNSSDLFVIDLDNDRIITSPLVSGEQNLETFPVFSPDGRWIYYCTAKAIPLPDSIKQLQYDLCRIAFDPERGQFGQCVDTLVRSAEINGSISYPKVSPDGKWLMYTRSGYGTFPVWHPEATLHLLDMDNPQPIQEPVVSTTGTWHSWSSDSGWFVFASKQDDGLYGKPYFSYVDERGVATKPFVLPQKDPAWYDYTLKSFNIPELGKGPLSFDAIKTSHIYHHLPTETLQLEE